MNAKASFGTLMVLIGLVGMWALVTGKFSKLISDWKTASAPATTATGTASSSAPGPTLSGDNSANGKTLAYDPHLPSLPSLAAYGVNVGGGVGANPAGTLAYAG
jgi:hypothetical protein